MSDTELQDRLRGYANSFDGLLSLIPAKMYYPQKEKEKSQEQWKPPKAQTKEQAKAAKRGKLDPDSELNRSAKEELEERARNKRKLQDIASNDDESDSGDDTDISFLEGVKKEKPLEGLKVKNGEPSAKKVKVDKKDTEDMADEAVDSTAKPSAETDEADPDDDMAPIDVSGLVTDEADGSAESEGSSPKSPVFDANSTANTASVEASSTTTSISSTIPPSQKPRIKLPADTTALRARLEAKLEAMRAGRTAKDGSREIRTRQELIEARREKQLKRRAHKKEMRAKAKEEEDRKREEAVNSSRNSPLSMMSPMFNDPDDGRSANHFAFGRLAFSDGTQMSHDLSYQKPASEKKKGPSDPKTALAKLEAQKKRLASLDEDKRKEVLEKDTWLAARRRAEGEKVHDSESLLKKAVKRKEKAKKKSEKEWKERAQGVEKAIKDRQHKREENLRKRREEKASRGKGKKKGVSTKSKNRPGFEGSFGGGRKK